MKISYYVAAVCAALAMAGPASAKDWIENVDLGPDGIDLVPIEVRAGGNGYSAIRTSQHRFSIRLYARAKSGKRIAAGKLGSHNGTGYFESDGGRWTVSFAGRDVGSGSLRTLQRTYSIVAPVARLGWHGADPVEACNALLATKMNQGMSRAEVLSEHRTTTANVFFQFEAVAARRKNAENGTINLGNTTTERGSDTYPVRVRCLAKPARASG